MAYSHKSSAYGGSGWSPRKSTLREEVGTIWGRCGASTEYSNLRTVLLHRPGPEIRELVDADAVQMIEIPDAAEATRQHDSMAQAYRDAGVAVQYVDPEGVPTPNMMFTADLFFMTPEGAILGRPASTVRAGEERQVARRLAGLGIPIVKSVRGSGTFEGADAIWIDPEAAFVGTGHRTNRDGASQVASALMEMGVEPIMVGLPYGTMHLMGTLRIVDEDLAVAWPGKVPYAVVEALRERGFEVLFIPDQEEAVRGMPMNFVALSPRRILMPAGNPVTQEFFTGVGIRCESVEIGELVKAAGAIGCLTGILEREL
jgi:N-dimethylarginine dimethylaminohydrolase